MRFVLIFLMVCGIAFAFALLLFTFFKSPKEKMQARELEFMKLQYEVLNDRLDNLEILMSDMEQRDNNLYRVMFEADPIPNSTRFSGFSDPDRYAKLIGYKNSDQVLRAARKLDVLASRLYNQSVSYDSVFAMARNKSDMLAHIPAIMPLKVTDLKYISSDFGYRPDPIYKITKFHGGMDFSAPMGTEVYATGDGVVADVDKSLWGYGNMVIIDHGFGYATRYAHLQKAAVRKGQKADNLLVLLVIRVKRRVFTCITKCGKTKFSLTQSTFSSTTSHRMNTIGCYSCRLYPPKQWIDVSLELMVRCS